MQEFFEVLIGWANDGRAGDSGMPDPLRLAVLLRHFKDSIRSSSKWRNFTAWLLAPFGRILGYHKELEKYAFPEVK
ncbi:hypothetical protein [Microbulbifer epialgicus]|uniref:Uncharacterized protein n=1 Tax=Microbulbifer epialgicus TaxID=393907 RepID=A0ABV4P3Y9_9GAMM